MANRRALRRKIGCVAPAGQYVYHVKNFLYSLRMLHLPWITTGLAKWTVGRRGGTGGLGVTWLIRLLLVELPVIARGLFWRVMVRLMGGRMGPRARIHEGARIIQGSGHATIEIGADFRMLRNAAVNTGPNGRIRIGNHLHLGENSMITAIGDVVVGDDVTIGPQTIVVDADHVFADPTKPIRAQGLKTSPVRIGNDVWVASHVTVVKGVTIGDGCVVGAGAVVTSDMPPYSIVLGVPAKAIGRRPTVPPLGEV